MLSTLALKSIQAYQVYLSPRKGYGCAYRIRHGGTGCSGFAKMAIADRGLIRAIPDILNRFKACKAAALQLAAERQPEPDDGQRRQRKRDWCDPCAGVDCSCPAGSSGSKSGCDLTPDCAPDCCSL